MELTHKLTYNNVTTVIDEPIGFDDLKMTLKRHEYHGIGAEVSESTLEFYGEAYAIIMQAYSADIDSEVVYEVLADATTAYSGKIDLSTCSVKEEKYRSVSAKVGEIGAKTTFNNRVETEIDLNTPKTVDGVEVLTPGWLNLHIPMKHLLYTNKAKQKEDAIVNSRSTWGGAGDGDLEGDVALDDVSVNEYGIFCNEGMLFEKDEDFDAKFGQDTVSSIATRVSVEFSWNSVIITESGDNISGTLKLFAGSTEIATAQFIQVSFSDKFATATIQFTQDIPTDSLRLHYNMHLSRYSERSVEYFGVKIKVKAGGYIEMTMYDNITEDDPVSADMLLAHDALNIVSHAISENALSVKSDWFRTPESKWNAGSTGGGALKALTNGYKIRGLFADEDNKRNMPVSFKTLIQSLDAIDCIGWGFSEESGATYVRVERWGWFYQNAVMLTLTDVAEVITDVDTDSIVTELIIGYKKYATSDEYNSIESPHGTRTFNSGIKAVTRSLSRECEFVADNYAIEETRRAKSQKKETEETTYDETIFVFELTRRQYPTAPQATYEIGHTSIDAQNVGRREEFINAKLTPRHMAARWRDYLFAANSQHPLRFTSGEINYKSTFKTVPEGAQPVAYTEYLQSSAITSPQAENDDITKVQSIIKAERITFSHPLTIDQYKTIKANPYGLVSVNGKVGWIRDFKYSFHDGMADFTLISKR